MNHMVNYALSMPYNAQFQITDFSWIVFINRKSEESEGGLEVY